VAGIDVAKAKADVCTRLLADGVQLVVMEATSD
jgi:hypothetical protein